MVEDPLGSSVPFVYVCSSCGNRFRADDSSVRGRRRGPPRCPRCGGDLEQRHRV